MQGKRKIYFSNQYFNEKQKTFIENDLNQDIEQSKFARIKTIGPPKYFLSCTSVEYYPEDIEIIIKNLEIFGVTEAKITKNFDIYIENDGGKNADGT